MENIISLLAQKISENQEKISEFFDANFKKTPALFYNSSDLRNAGFKITSIDLNCFPAGFNNFDAKKIAIGSQLASSFFKKDIAGATTIQIIPENHTRNLKYLENVKNLEKVLKGAKKEVKIGSLIEDLTEKQEIELDNGESLIIHPIKKENGEILDADGFKPDVIILNNDLTDGIPEILQNVKTPIFPDPKLGWHQRLKSEHFEIYNQLAGQVAEILNIDPWLISTIHTSCDEVNFKEKVGLEELAQKVDETLAKIKEKYQKHNIDSEPFCFVKADSGTYGMAIWSVNNGQEILDINKKERNKMNKIKGSIANSRVLIQEGVPSQDKILGKFAEPMIYMINGSVAANLFRANESRSEKTSLNSPGAEFFDLDNLENEDIALGENKDNLKIVYSLIARLGALASAIEN